MRGIRKSAIVAIANRVERGTFFIILIESCQVSESILELIVRGKISGRGQKAFGYNKRIIKGTELLNEVNSPNKHESKGVLTRELLQLFFCRVDSSPQHA